MTEARPPVGERIAHSGIKEKLDDDRMGSVCEADDVQLDGSLLNWLGMIVAEWTEPSANLWH